MFILYDGRAKTGQEGDASVMDTAETEAEARQKGKTTWKGHDAIWYEYEDVDGKARPDLPPCGG